MEARKKQINIVFYTLIICSFITLFIFPQIAHAKEYDIYSGFLATELDQICRGISESVNDVLGLGALDKLAAENMDELSPVLTHVYDFVKIIGAFWCIIIAMGHLITNIDRGQDPMECVFKIFIELGITFVFLMNLSEIISLISQLGKEIIEVVGNSMSSDEQEVAREQLVIALTGSATGGWSWEFKAIAALFIPYLLSYVLTILAVFVLVQIIIEIAIRKAFTPLAVADIYQDGLRSSGVRYLKKLLAAFLKLAACVLVCNIIPGLTSSLTSASEPYKQILYIIAVNASCVGIMFKTGEVANDIVGA